MTDTSFASLCPTLLARKGGAKPAMRPQLGLASNLAEAMNGDLSAANLEDLGWNDMGDEMPEGGTLSNVVPIASDTVEVSTTPALAPEVANPVKTNLDQLAGKLDLPKRKSASVPKNLKGGKRAAFTLRLDPERHLRLRLASTIRNCSAQQFVTDALDSLLRDMPEIDELAAQVSRG